MDGFRLARGCAQIYEWKTLEIWEFVFEIGLEWRSCNWMGKALGLLLEMVCWRRSNWSL
jgi:hypothetical protein